MSDSSLIEMNEAPPPWLSDWGGLPAGCQAACQWLIKACPQPDQALIVCHSPSPSLAALAVAALICGRRLCLLSPDHPHNSERIALLRSAYAISAVVESLPNFPVHDSSALPALAASDEPSETTAVWTLFGSGSSGNHRAVSLQRSALLSAARSGVDHLQMQRSQRWLLCLPMDHIGGLMLLLRAACAGSALQIFPRFDAPAVTAAMSHCHGLSLVPTMAKRILACSETSWPLRPIILLGGAGCPQAWVDALIARDARPLRCWGATETSAMVTCQGLDHVGAEHCGTSLAGMRVRSDPQGVLAVWGPALAREWIHSDGRIETLDREAWLVTGDCGHIDPAGHVFILGRHDGAIHSGGETVFPEVVNQRLSTHPAILHSAVLSIDDEEWGQSLAAMVVLRQGGDIDAIRAWSQQHLAPAERPKRYLAVDALPLLDNGKVDRLRIRQALTDLS